MDFRDTLGWRLLNALGSVGRLRHALTGRPPASGGGETDRQACQVSHGERIDKPRLAEFCEKHHTTKLALFGSVLTDRFNEESDIDFLVEFHPDHIPGLIRLSGMEIELSKLIGRKADMRTKNDLSRYFRDEVVKDAVVQYAA